jgi:hypothetical protein
MAVSRAFTSLRFARKSAAASSRSASASATNSQMIRLTGFLARSVPGNLGFLEGNLQLNAALTNPCRLHVA